MNIEELVKQIAKLQRQVDGLIKPEVGRWVDWTPIVTQGGSTPTLDIRYAKYWLKDSTVHLRVDIGVTSAGTANQEIKVGGIPTAVQPAYTSNVAVIGPAMIIDVSVAQYTGVVVAFSANQLRFWHEGAGGAIGVEPNFALASGDTISFLATYEQT